MVEPEIKDVTIVLSNRIIVSESNPNHRFFFKNYIKCISRKKRKTQKKFIKIKKKPLKRCRYAKCYRLLCLFFCDGSKT